MPLVISLLIIAGLFAIVSTGFCALFNSIEGYWPRWHFRLFFAWWWPFRADSAATLASIAIDADPEAWKVVNGGMYRGRAIASDALKARVSEGYLDNGMSLSVDSKNVPLSLWDDFTLSTSFRRWQSRRTEADRQAATLEAAATFSRAFRAKYRTGL